MDKREDLDVRRAMHKTAQRNGITYDDDMSEEDDAERVGIRDDDTGLGSRQAKRLKKAEKNGTVVDIDQGDETAEPTTAVKKAEGQPANKVKRPKAKKASLPAGMADGI